ncbi:hypothetical protein [Azonexus fungiphilus]|uniref:hypothetical protein n=1 Tax=Azonexus fungiphilus TaxID=146940 RepID=UPI00156B6603|nr:hypothetical protein [Azonexus fungiphilus]NHC08361.1 hypothetical protein [Azonexus fungiphilus]
MTEPKRKGLLHFSTRSYPTFGRGKKAAYDEANPPKTVTSSPYYWWFKFLQLNEDYKATCAANGEGKCAALYADFGDIYNTDFKQWWSEHAHLFAERQKQYSFRIAKSESQLVPFDSPYAVNLTVPLNYDRQTLLRLFEKVVLSKVAESKRGVHVEGSDAKYKLSGKWHIEAMATAYKVYVLRQQVAAATDFERTDSKTGTKKSVKRFDVSWADIAIRAKLSGTLDLKEGIANSSNNDERRQATVLAIRHYKRAVEFIKKSTKEKFPH